MKKPLKVILATEGGGTRGRLTARWLTRVEELLGEPLSNRVSLFAGTSTGSIIACALASGRYSASQLFDFYWKHGEEIFPPSWWITKLVRRRLTGAMYNPKPLEKLLQEYFSKKSIDNSMRPLLMGDAIKPVICESFEWTTDRPVTISNWLHPDLEMWRAMLSSSSAPFYLPISEVSFGQGQEAVGLVDGGLDCNAPGVDAMTHLYLNDGVPLHEIAVISVGTGRPRRFTPIRKLRRMWAHQLLKKTVNTAMSTERVSRQLRILGDRFVEINADLPDGIDASMDNGSKEQMRDLANFADSHIARHPEQFEKAVDLLKRAA